MASSSTARAALLALVLVACPAMAAAQTDPQTDPPSPAEELRQLRAEMAVMIRRMDELEARARAEDEARAARKAEKASQNGIAEAKMTAAAEMAESVAPALLRPSSKSAIAVPPGPIGRALQAAGSELELSAASESSRVSIRLTRDIAETHLGGRAQGRVTTTRLSFAASAPVAKKGPRTDLATSDGFTSDFEVRLGLSRYVRTLRNPLMDQETLGIMAAALKACKDKPGTTKEEVVACDNAPRNGTLILTYLGAAEERRYLSRLAPPGGVAYGGEVHLGYSKHEFVDTVAIASDEKSETPWGVRGYVSYLPRPLTSFTAALEYAEGMKDQKAGVLCPPFGGGAVTCLSGPLGAPKDQEKVIGSFEYRQLFPLPKDWILKGVGIAALVSHDFKGDTTQFDLPIYLVPDAKGAFVGGVRLGWDSEEHDIVAGVFFSSALSPRQQ